MKKFISLVLATTMMSTMVFANEVTTEQNIESNRSFEMLESIGEFEVYDELETEVKGNDIVFESKNGFDFSGVVSTEQKKTRVAGYHNASSAFYLGASNLNTFINDTADGNQNWYYFQASPTDKVSVYLQNTNTGDYDIYLFKYNADGTLTQVASSEYTNSDEKLSYIGDSSHTGYYWLAVVPYVASSPSELYTLRVDTVSNFDSYEPNDTHLESVDFNSEINVKGSIDSFFDRDFYSLTFPSSGTYNLDLKNVPSGNSYLLSIYNESLQLVGNALCTDDRALSLSGTKGNKYYFVVESYDGTYNASQNYELKVYKPVTYRGVAYKSGNYIIEVDGTNLYINNQKVNIEWDYSYNVNYTREEHLDTTGLYEIRLAAKTRYRDGFAKGDSFRSEEALVIYLNGAKVQNYYNNISSYNGEPVAKYDVTVINPEFYIDLATAEFIDFPESTFYRISGKKSTDFAHTELQQIN